MNTQPSGDTVNPIFPNGLALNQVEQLVRLCIFWVYSKHPWSDYVSVYELMKQTIGTADLLSEPEEPQGPQDIEEPEEPNIRHNGNGNGSSRGKSFKPTKITKTVVRNQAYLVGQPAHNRMSIKTQKFKGNPFNIPIDKHEYCKTCGKVGISSIKLDYKGDEWTYVNQIFRHTDTNTWHRKSIERFDGRLTWEEIVDRKLKSNKNVSLDSFRPIEIADGAVSIQEICE